VSSMDFSDLQTATGEELVRLIHEALPDMLFPLLDNPALDEKRLSLCYCIAKICQANF